MLWATLQEEDIEEPLVVYTHPLDPSNRILHKVHAWHTELTKELTCTEHN